MLFVGGFVYTPVQSIRLLTMTTLPAKLDAIPAVDIDNGRFKYILIRVDLHNAETNEETSKFIVRGYTWAAFHGKRTQYFVILYTLRTPCNPPPFSIPSVKDCQFKDSIQMSPRTSRSQQTVTFTLCHLKALVDSK